MGVNKLIETLIQESFALPTLHNPDTKSGFTISQQQQPTTSVLAPGEGERTKPNLDSDPNTNQPLRHVNKPLDGAKSLKRKRAKRTESLDSHSLDARSLSVNTVTQPGEESTREYVDNRAEGIVVQPDPADGVVLSPKRLRESTTASMSTDETCPDISSAASDLYKTSSDAVRIAGAWHLIDNILNERVIDSNGGRAREEINNNSREKAMISVVDHEGLVSTNKALRKSKRANQGLRYKELMSKGVLYASRKSLDSK